MSAKGPKGSIFRMFKPEGGGSKEENVEKRREQVRRAQHVYRQRKTRYVKALEGDIESSRRRERHMSEEKKDLEYQVRVLLHVLDQHGIATPEIGPRPRDDGTGPGSASALGSGSGLGSGSASQILSPTSQDDALQWRAEAPQASTPLSALSPLSLDSSDSALMASRVCDVDMTTLGMKFVLKIEEPCLGHVHGDPAKPDEPSGHALTTTSQVLCLSSSPPPKRSSLMPIQDGTENILHRLLSLAPALSSGEEITPIQAWNELRCKPVLGSLDLKCVLQLAEKLRDAAKCHGFGAVVDYTVFMQLLGEMMSYKISFAPNSAVGGGGGGGGQDRTTRFF